MSQAARTWRLRARVAKRNGAIALSKRGEVSAARAGSHVVGEEVDAPLLKKQDCARCIRVRMHLLRLGVSKILVALVEIITFYQCLRAK